MSDSDSEIELRQKPGTSLNAQSEEVEDEIDIAGLVTKLLSDRKNANVLCDLLRFIQTDDLDEEELFFTVGAIEKWFLQQIDDGFMKSSQVESKKKYGEWIGKQMKAFIGVMCQKASIEDYSDIIFPCLIRLYKLELETRTKHIETGKIIRKVATHLCSFEEDRIEEIEKFSEYLIHPDFVIELLRKMTELMENYKDRNDILAGNVLYFLQAISDVFPEEVTSDMNMSSRSSISTKSLKTAVQSFITAFLRRQLTDNLTKKILVKMSIILPMCSNPLLIADYIVACYDSTNSSIAFLALSGIFTLVSEFNFEYPDFFQKVYRLLSDDVVYAANRVQVLHLINMFLQSPKLPVSYQYAFCKRLSRLALLAPTPVTIGIMPVIFNLIRSSQSLRLLINRPSADVVEEDPYVHTAENVEDSRAAESCLWELESLRKHFVPEVKRLASKISTSLGRVDDPIPTDVTYMTMTQKVLDGQKNEEYPLAIDRPKCLIVDDLFVEG